MRKGHCVINEHTTSLGVLLLCQLQTFSKLCVNNAQQIRMLRKYKNTSSLSPKTLLLTNLALFPISVGSFLL